MEVTELLCVLAGILLFGLMKLVNPDGAQEASYIPRNGYGQGKDTVGLMLEVPGHSEGAVEITFPVEERQ